MKNYDPVLMSGELDLKGEKENIIPLFDLSTQEGFEAVYKAYFEKMNSIAYAKTNCVETAGNIVQEIFISLWERREEVRFTNSVENYLMRALRFKLVDYFRANEIRKKHLEIQKAHTIELDSSTEKEINFNGLKERLEALVNQLPEKSQKIYRLSRERGMTNKQISKTLLIPERTISTHLAKALSFLKDNLRNDYTFHP